MAGRGVCVLSGAALEATPVPSAVSPRFAHLQTYLQREEWLGNSL